MGPILPPMGPILPPILPTMAHTNHRQVTTRRTRQAFVMAHRPDRARPDQTRPKWRRPRPARSVSLSSHWATRWETTREAYTCGATSLRWMQVHTSLQPILPAWPSLGTCALYPFGARFSLSAQNRTTATKCCPKHVSQHCSRCPYTKRGAERPGDSRSDG